MAENVLSYGFTTVRDAGGPALGLKRAIDEGIIWGPRIYASGPMLSQTSGHFDFDSTRSKASPYFTGIPDKAVMTDWTRVADGVGEVTKASREILRTGAAQIKIASGAGLASEFDPAHAWEFTREEIRAIVYEAKKWDTYVMSHSFSDEGTRIAIEEGVRSIEHGYDTSDETLLLMKKKDAFMVTQFYLYMKQPEDFGLSRTDPRAIKYLNACKDFESLWNRTQNVGVKMAFSTDAFGTWQSYGDIKNEWSARAKYYSPYEVLVQATSNAAELLSYSGKLNPYQEGALGVIKEGAYADLLIVDGDPLQDISLLADPEKNLKLIMKDGKIYKSTLK